LVVMKYFWSALIPLCHHRYHQKAKSLPPIKRLYGDVYSHPYYFPEKISITSDSIGASVSSLLSLELKVSDGSLPTPTGSKKSSVW